jgi:hypothetical protein
MRSIRTFCKLATLLVLAWQTTFPSALAQDSAEAPAPQGAPSPPPPAEDEALARAKKQAEERFVRGLQLARTQAWDEALAEFLASRELFPTRVAAKNAAMSLERLRRYAEAIEMTQELLDRFGDSLSPDDRMTALDDLERLRQNTATLVIRSNEQGATVVVDSRERGVTPLPAPVVVDPGTHVVRVFKEGFVGHDTQVVLAGKQAKEIVVELAALERSGKLRVQEASGKPLDVVIDGVVVGKTPWTGLLSVGTHTVFLRGSDDVGTPPSSATVFANQLSTLTLGAARMDARLRVEPTPSSARVHIDGVPVGLGVWEGRLKSGTHKVEVAEEGFIAYRADTAIKSGGVEVLRVRLERDLSNPMWRGAVFQPHVYAELFAGAAFSPSFGGSADAACSNGDCSDRSRPLGFTGGARGGYQLTSGLGLEVFFAYLRMRESVTREQTAAGELGMKLASDDYLDETLLAGPAFGVSASYRFLEQTPVLLRVWAGVMRANASFENGGTFSGSTATRDFDVSLTVPERSAQLWVPLVGPEARVGYRLSDSLTIDVGVALLAAFPKSVTREGRTTVSRGDRAVVLPDLSGGERLGVARLPAETGFGTFFTVLPTLGGRFDF